MSLTSDVTIHPHIFVNLFFAYSLLLVFFFASSSLSCLVNDFSCNDFSTPLIGHRICYKDDPSLNSQTGAVHRTTQDQRV